jgi:putative transposase
VGLADGLAGAPPRARGPWSGVNHKRIRRLWPEEGLRRPARAHKRRRVTPDQTERSRAEHPNQVWAIDFQFDETADGAG